MSNIDDCINEKFHITLNEESKDEAEEDLT
jgi:hypothetical protein